MAGRKYDPRQAARLEGFWRRLLASWREVPDVAGLVLHKP